MTYTVSGQALDGAIDAISELGELVEVAKLNAINSAAKEFRTEIIGDISSGTGLGRRLVRSRTRVERATKRRDQAKIISSSQGLPITEYTWRQESAGHPTRARILIRWFGAWKVVPGFVNPMSRRPLPMKTIKGSKRPVLAHGLSVAAGFKVVRDDGRLERYAERLAEIFQEKIQE